TSAALSPGKAPMNESERTIGPYRLLEVLGHGADGVVYRGRHEQSGAPAAIKTLRVPRAELALGLRREIQALVRASHPGVVRILDAGLASAEPWFAMEIIDGVSLRSLVASAAGGVHTDLIAYLPDTLAGLQPDAGQRAGEDRSLQAILTLV